MTELPERLTARIRRGFAVAGIGLSVATLVAVAGSVGLGALRPLYWLGIALALGGVLGAAVIEARATRSRYGIGVVSGVLGVLIAAYGVENHVLVATTAGILFVVIGAAVVVVDTQRVA